MQASANTINGVGGARDRRAAWRWACLLLAAMAIVAAPPRRAAADDPPAAKAQTQPPAAAELGQPPVQGDQPPAKSGGESQPPLHDAAPHGQAAQGDAPLGEAVHREAAHGDGHAHDPFDLSDRNPTPGGNLRQISVMGLVSEEGVDPLEDPAEIRFDMSLFAAIVFLVLLAALGKFAWKPIVAGLDQRESSIAAMIDEARSNQELSAQKLLEYEAKLAQAAADAQAMVTRAKLDAQHSAEKILADAEAAAARQRERALAEIESAKTSALSEIATRSVDAALGLAGNIMRKKLQRDEHADLIREALESISSQVLTDRAAAGDDPSFAKRPANTFPPNSNDAWRSRFHFAKRTPGGRRN